MTQRHLLMPTKASDKSLLILAAAACALLLCLPLFGSALMVDKLTLLMIYIVLGISWNLLAGYAGLVSVGQQAFIGLSGYFILRLVESGLPVSIALLLGTVIVVLAAIPISWFALRLKAAEFAVAMWVVAEAIRSLVMFDPLIQGETGRSLVALNSVDPDLRRNAVFIAAVIAASVAFFGSYLLLKGRIGAEAQAIRDDADAAQAVGISVKSVQRTIFLVSAFGCAVAGTLWLASSITYQPRTAFGINWSIFMLFIVLVGGLGSFLGPVLGAILLFSLQNIFGDFGAWWLAGVGLVAIVFGLFFPKGIVGLLADHAGLSPFTLRAELTPQSAAKNG